MKAKNIWITWEDHRRSRELAKAFDADYLYIPYKGAKIFRYFVLLLRTYGSLKNSKNKMVFCQNPSIFLAAFLCLFKSVFDYYLIVDRHSNFKFWSKGSYNPKWILFHYLSDWSLKNSDVTIVTNEYLKKFVESKGGVSFILPDLIPELPHAANIKEACDKKITFISTYSDDEPIFEILDAAKALGEDYKIYITGSYGRYKYRDLLIKNKPDNVVLTGFLSESEYQKQLAISDAVMVITTFEYTLTCGAYEAVSLGKPMILGDTKTIREYFSSGAEYAEPRSQDICDSVKKIFSDLDFYKSQVLKLKCDLKKDWDSKFRAVALFLEDKLND